MFLSRRGGCGDVGLLPREDRAVGGVVTENIGVAVEQVGFLRQLPGASFEEETPRVGVVREVEPHLVADSVCAQAPVEDLGQRNVAFERNDIAVGLVEGRQFLDAGVAPPFDQVFDHGRETLGELLAVGGLHDPVRSFGRAEEMALHSGIGRIEQVAVGGASPQHERHVGVHLLSDVQHLVERPHLGRFEREAVEGCDAGIAVVVEGFPPVGQQHHTEALNAHLADARHDDLVPVRGFGAVVAGDVLRQEMRVELHAQSGERDTRRTADTHFETRAGFIARRAGGFGQAFVIVGLCRRCRTSGECQQGQQKRSDGFRLSHTRIRG